MNGCDTIPKAFADLLDKECVGMSDLERVRAMRLVRLTLGFAREQYDHVGLALKNSEPDLMGGTKTVRA